MSSTNPKILFITDDLIFPSGVANMARNIVRNTRDRINWVLCAGAKYNSRGNTVDDYEGIKVYRFEKGFGDSVRIKAIIEEEVPDGILFFTDPKYFREHYELEYEVRQHIPYMFYTIWDNYPTPKYNLPFYQSTDGLFCISKQTEHMVRSMVGDEENKVIKYIPHGIDTTKFKLEPNEDKIAQFFKNQVIGNTKSWYDYEFISLWNNNNQDRKRPMDAMLAFNNFAMGLSEENREKVCMVMHTKPRHPEGSDLYVVREDLIDKSVNIFFTSQSLPEEEMYLLYNMADLTICNSDAEGFGLTAMESIMCEKPIIATVTGGLQDQMGFSREILRKTTGSDTYLSRNMISQDGDNHLDHGDWAFPLYPDASNIIGSLYTPYVFEDRTSIGKISEVIENAYNLRDKLQAYGKQGREWAIKNGFTTENMSNRIFEGIIETLNTFKPQKPINIIKF